MNKAIKIIGFTILAIILNIGSIYLVKYTGLLGQFEVETLPEVCKEWNSNNIMEINLVLSGLIMGPLLYIIYCNLEKVR